jgi:hypothetical protein
MRSPPIDGPREPERGQVTDPIRGLTPLIGSVDKRILERLLPGAGFFVIGLDRLAPPLTVIHVMPIEADCRQGMALPHCRHHQPSRTHRSVALILNPGQTLLLQSQLQTPAPQQSHGSVMPVVNPNDRAHDGASSSCGR